MKKIGVISDTHGRGIMVKQAVKALPDMDLWLHAGDNSQDVRFFEGLTTAPVVAAAGNCDGYHATAKLDEFLSVAGKNIWLTHGHRYEVKYGTRELIEKAHALAVDVVIYGHGHIPDITWDDDLLVLNPGSAGFPRGNIPTCALLVIDQGKITAQIIDIR